MNPNLDPVWPLEGETFRVTLDTDSSWYSDNWESLARWWKSASGELKTTALEIVDIIGPAEFQKQIVLDLQVDGGKIISTGDETSIDISDDIDNFTQWIKDTGVKVFNTTVEAASAINQHSDKVADEINANLKDAFGVGAIEDTVSSVGKGFQSFALYAAVAVVGLIYVTRGK